MARHPDWDTHALQLQAQLDIRHVDLEKLPPDRRRPFHTKLELAAAQLRWLKPRMYQGKLNKARRGELLGIPPIGEIRVATGEWVIDPDEQV